MLDLIEKLINERGSSTVLKERLELVRDKYHHLEKELDESRKRCTDGEAEIEELNAKLARLVSSGKNCSEFLSKPMAEFWKSFNSESGTNITVGTPDLWSFPGQTETEASVKIDSKATIKINDGILTMTNEHGGAAHEELKSDENRSFYMVPRLSAASTFDFECAYSVKDIFPEGSKATVVLDRDVKYAGDIVCIGGSRSNIAAHRIIERLIDEHKFDFSYKFAVRVPRDDENRERVLTHEVNTSGKVGIVDSSSDYKLVARYFHCGNTVQDCAIVILTFNPFNPDRRVLIIGGFEEKGTRGALEVLKSESSLRKINKIVHTHSSGSDFPVIEFVTATLDSSTVIVGRMKIVGKRVN